jgi:hypothetical protein
MSKNLDGGVLGSAKTVADEVYERPSLVPIGNLHDLLLGASGTLCDAATTLTDGLVEDGENCI